MNNFLDLYFFKIINDFTDYIFKILGSYKKMADYFPEIVYADILALEILEFELLVE